MFFHCYIDEKKTTVIFHGKKKNIFKPVLVFAWKKNSRLFFWGENCFRLKKSSNDVGDFLHFFINALLVCYLFWKARSRCDVWRDVGRKLHRKVGDKGQLKKLCCTYKSIHKPKRKTVRIEPLVKSMLFKHTLSYLQNILRYLKNEKPRHGRNIAKNLLIKEKRKTQPWQPLDEFCKKKHRIKIFLWIILRNKFGRNHENRPWWNEKLKKPNRLKRG